MITSQRTIAAKLTRMEERLLLSLCMSPDAVESCDYDYAHPPSTEDPLSILRRDYHDLPSLVFGKRVLDFGCGAGRQAVALATEGGCRVTGFDTNRKILQTAIAHARGRGLDERRVDLCAELTDDMIGAFDVVISQNSMEHFPDPKLALRHMRALIHQDGIILITFGCPWYSPYGSHMHFFCKVPWLNILFSEQAVMAVRSRFRADGAARYEDVESGLNKMSLQKFERLITESGLDMMYRKLIAVKRLPVVTRIPIVRELLTNHVSCVLRPQ